MFGVLVLVLAFIFSKFKLKNSLIINCFILVNIALFQGEFLPLFYILCYSLYVLSSSKRGDCWPKKVTLSICICFDDNKTHRSYLILISCFRMSFRFVQVLMAFKHIARIMALKAG